MACGKLVFFCGKMGAGKSTKAKELTQELNAVLFSEDEWLAALYPGQIKTLEDYVHFSRRLKLPIASTVKNNLVAGTNVVMDFPGNTLTQRQWFKDIYSDVGAAHALIHIDVPDEVCLAQIESRRLANPERAATDTKAMFEKMNQYFEPPRAEEGFNLVVIDGGGLR